MHKAWNYLKYLLVLIAFLITALIGLIVWITYEDPLPQSVNRVEMEITQQGQHTAKKALPLIRY